MVAVTPVQCALLALHEEWCGEGGTHFLVELALRTSAAAPRSLHEGLNWEGRGGGGVVLGV